MKSKNLPLRFWLLAWVIGHLVFVVLEWRTGDIARNLSAECDSLIHTIGFIGMEFVTCWLGCLVIGIVLAPYFLLRVWRIERTERKKSKLSLT